MGIFSLIDLNVYYNKHTQGYTMTNQFLEEVALEEQHEETLSFQDGMEAAEAHFAMESLKSDYETYTNSLALIVKSDELSLESKEALALALDTDIATVDKMKEDNVSTEGFGLVIIGFLGGYILGALIELAVKLGRKLNAYLKNDDKDDLVKMAKDKVKDISDEDADKILAKYVGLSLMTEANVSIEPMLTSLQGLNDYANEIDKTFKSLKDVKEIEKLILDNTKQYEIKVGGETGIFAEYKKSALVLLDGKEKLKVSYFKLKGASGLSKVIDMIDKDDVSGKRIITHLDNDLTDKYKVVYKQLNASYELNIKSDTNKVKILKSVDADIVAKDVNYTKFLHNSVTDPYHYYTDTIKLLKSL